MFTNFFANLEDTYDYITYSFKQQGQQTEEPIPKLKVKTGAAEYFGLSLYQGQDLQEWTYTRPTFFDFFADFSGTALGAMSVGGFLLKTHMAFDANRTMLTHLYWKRKARARRAGHSPDSQVVGHSKFLDEREPFTYNYASFFFMFFWERFCCCFCKDSKAVRDYRMYTEARDRLGAELDVLNLIKLNRVSRFLHKALLKRSHRKVAWTLSKKTTISEADIDLN